MKPRMLVTAATCLLLVAVYAAVYVLKALSANGVEGYERDWTFQLLMFALTPLPWLIVILSVSLLLYTLRRRRRMIDTCPVDLLMNAAGMKTVAEEIKPITPRSRQSGQE